MGQPRGKGGKSRKGGGKGKGTRKGRSGRETRHPWGPPTWERTWVRLRNSCQGPGFRVVTYNLLAPSNLEAHSFMYGRAARLGYSDWWWREYNIVQELGGYDAEVVCLQEVEPSAVSSLGGQLGLTTACWAPRAADKVDGCAILYDAAKWNLVGGGMVPLIVDGRSGAGVVAALERNGFTLIVATAHLLFNPKRGDLRLQQARILLQAAAEQLAKVTRPEHSALILCGDLNSGPESAVYQLIRGGDPATGSLGQPETEREVDYTPIGHAGAGTCILGQLHGAAAVGESFPVLGASAEHVQEDLRLDNCEGSTARQVLPTV